MDIRFLFSSRRHFDDEEFIEGRKIITGGLSAVKASNKRENFEAAREKLGEILHTLQVILITALVSFTAVMKSFFTRYS